MNAIQGELVSVADVTSFAIPEDAVENGEVFTRRWVVDLMLDACGYTADRDLALLVAEEPACGAGAFLVPMVERLSTSLRQHGRTLTDATDAIRAFDLLPRNVDAARKAVMAVLTADGWNVDEVPGIVEQWVRQGDYLLTSHSGADVDFVIGNPPYIRLEEIPANRQAAYRATCRTMGGRADIYVGFYEVGLRNLRPGGVLAFICADRWMRNDYGKGLRELVSGGFSMDLVLVAHDVDAFDEQVSAYPAITLISARRQGSVIVANATADFGPVAAAEFLKWSRSRSKRKRAKTFTAAVLPHWHTGAASWPDASPERLALLEDLLERFQPMEDAKGLTRVRIGVATGADAVFVVKRDKLPDVEEGRLLPLVMNRDTQTGTLAWSGAHLVNPWDADGLVDLAKFPKLAAYFEQHAPELTKRHIAQARPGNWFGTIDRVNMGLVDVPKLLLPDMKMYANPVLEPGGLYPHHNLYYITSDVWDLRVLGGLLLSRVCQFFIECYAVRMRGGTLRFQAQYLRRIVVPSPDAIGSADAQALAEAFDRRDVDGATVAALRVYGIEQIPE